MKKEIKIKVPEGYEIDKENSTFECIKFKAKGKGLPKKWIEFCTENPIKIGECYIEDYSEISQHVASCRRMYMENRNVLPNRETAEAILALCQLIQLRDCYNQGWKPDWKDNKDKHVIDFYTNEIDSEYWEHRATSFLYFKTEELRDLFLENFRDLIEKLKPLYGIKEGGEK